MRTKVPEEAELGFQITPMVDIVALLIMFFMCCAGSVKTETQIGVTLPGGADSGHVVDVEVYVGIKPDGSITFNEAPIANPEDDRLIELRSKLKSIMQKFGEKTPVFIQPDPGVVHQRVVNVLDACAASGVKNLTFQDVTAG
ncbi:MAG: biopolymer transporter ExbD [Verrucomicrobia bacterium]|nr:biopolymer transporter ExbD [Verrucomicrobiota bacterium]